MYTLSHHLPSFDIEIKKSFAPHILCVTDYLSEAKSSLIRGLYEDPIENYAHLLVLAIFMLQILGLLYYFIIHKNFFSKGKSKNDGTAKYAKVSYYAGLISKEEYEI